MNSERRLYKTSLSYFRLFSPFYQEQLKTSVKEVDSFSRRLQLCSYYETLQTTFFSENLVCEQSNKMLYFYVIKLFLTL